MAFITAQTGKNVKALVNLAQSLFKQSRNRVSTGTLNRDLARGRRRPSAGVAREPGCAHLLRHPGRSDSAHRRPVRQQHEALRRDLSALSAQRLPRTIAVSRHPHQALHAIAPPGRRKPPRATTENWEETSDAIDSGKPPHAPGARPPRHPSPGPLRCRQPLLEPRSERVALRSGRLKTASILAAVQSGPMSSDAVIAVVAGPVPVALP